MEQIIEMLTPWVGKTGYGFLRLYAGALYLPHGNTAFFNAFKQQNVV